MNDRELLELAAKAAGYDFEIFCDGRSIRRDIDGQPIYWNPITDDRDALRLAVKLKLDLFVFEDYIEVIANTGNDIEPFSIVPFKTDQYAETRRAIVRAAAEIGKLMP